MKSISYLALVASLLVTLACQKHSPENVTVAQIAEGLLEQGDEPYRVSFRIQIAESQEGHEKANIFEAEGVMLHSSEWVSCTLEDLTFGGYKMGRVFHKQAKGLSHSLSEEGNGGPVEWECQSHGSRGMPLIGIGGFRQGGWSLSSQAGGLIKDFPPTRKETLESGPILYWDSVSADLGRVLREQFRVVGFEDSFEVENLSLGISQNLKSPIFLDIKLKSGREVRAVYSEFDLLQGDYYARLNELRSELRVDDSIRCWCDGEIYDVQLELPGRPIR